MALNDKSRFRRIAGMTAISAGIAIALPLTATVSYAYVEAGPPEAPHALAPPLSSVSPDTPAAPQQFVHQPDVPLAPAEAESDYNGDLDIRRDDGERRQTVIRSERVDGDAYVDREEIRRSLQDVPSREEMRRILDDIPSREELQAMIPEINVEDRCDGSGEPVTSEVRAGADGRPESVHVMICDSGMRELALQSARDGLRQARRELAASRDLSRTTRDEALADIDREIARLEHERD